MALIAASMIGSAGLGLYGAYESNKAIKSANKAQQEGMQKGLDLTRQQYEQGRQDLMPWTQAGRGALKEQQALMGLGGDTAGALRSLQSSLGYSARLSLGNRMMEGGSAARGGMGSGKALTAAQNYGQDYALNEYGNRLNQLAGLSSTGQSSAGGQASAGANYAGNMSNLWSGGADAQAQSGLAANQATQSSLLGAAQLGLSGYQAMTQPKYDYTTGKWMTR